MVARQPCATALACLLLAALAGGALGEWRWRTCTGGRPAPRLACCRSLPLTHPHARGARQMACRRQRRTRPACCPAALPAGPRAAPPLPPPLHPAPQARTRCQSSLPTPGAHPSCSLGWPTCPMPPAALGRWTERWACFRTGRTRCSACCPTACTWSAVRGLGLRAGAAGRRGWPAASLLGWAAGRAGRRRAVRIASAGAGARLRCSPREAGSRARPRARPPAHSPAAAPPLPPWPPRRPLPQLAVRAGCACERHLSGAGGAGDRAPRRQQCVGGPAGRGSGRATRRPARSHLACCCSLLLAAAAAACCRDGWRMSSRRPRHPPPLPRAAESEPRVVCQTGMIDLDIKRGPWLDW